MVAPKTPDSPISLLNLPATSQQRVVVFAIAAALVATAAIAAPFATVQLPVHVSFNPTVEAVVFVNDLHKPFVAHLLIDALERAGDGDSTL